MTPLSAGLLLLVLAVASVIDLRQRIIPNRLTLAAALAGLTLAAAGGPGAAILAAAAGLALTAPLLAAALVRPSGMGMGDVKLVAVIGIFLGRQAWPALLAGLLLAGLAGALISVGTRSHPSLVALPLAPFLAMGALPVVISAL